MHACRLVGIATGEGIGLLSVEGELLIDWSSVELGDLFDSTEFRVPVVHVQTLALESILLHPGVVVGADGVEVWACCQLLQLLLRRVKIEDFFHAVVVLAHVVLVLEDAQGALDLILKAKVHF